MAELKEKEENSAAAAAASVAAVPTPPALNRSMSNTGGFSSNLLARAFASVTDVSSMH